MRPINAPLRAERNITQKRDTVSSLQSDLCDDSLCTRCRLTFAKSRFAPLPRRPEYHRNGRKLPPKRINNLVFIRTPKKPRADDTERYEHTDKETDRQGHNSQDDILFYDQQEIWK